MNHQTKLQFRMGNFEGYSILRCVQNGILFGGKLMCREQPDTVHTAGELFKRFKILRHRSMRVVMPRNNRHPAHQPMVKGNVTFAHPKDQ